MGCTSSKLFDSNKYTKYSDRVKTGSITRLNPRVTELKNIITKALSIYNTKLVIINNKYCIDDEKKIIDHRHKQLLNKFINELNECEPIVTEEYKYVLE